MRGARASATAVVVVAALLGAACGGDNGGDPPGAGDTSAPSWEEVARTLEPGLDPASENPCRQGTAACVDVILAEMEARLERLGCDHTAPFAVAYVHVTEGVQRAAGQDAYRQPAWIRHLDAVFADLYFDAFDAWRAGRTDGVPRAWQLAFQTAEGRDVNGVGNMLLGINAHISRDLPFALAAIGLQRPDGSDAKPDFDAVNAAISQAQGAMLADVVDRYDPSADDFAIPALQVDETTVDRLIALWREEAWHRGEQLATAATSAERASVASSIEATATSRALLIRSSTGYLPFVSGPESRDRHCASRVD